MKKDYNILELKNIHKTFGDDLALSDVTFSVKNGEFISVLGPSGCGKTTLLRLIGGFEKVDEGEIFIKNKLANDVSSSLRKVNTVFQNYALFPHMNVFDNIAFGLRVDKKNKEYIEDEVHLIGKKLDLMHLLKRMPHQLSGGQKQRVAIARAAVKKPEILLLDEPMSALDKNLRQRTQIELKQLQKQLGITFILVTHDQEEALSVADRVIVMNHGEIEQIGTPRDVYENPINLFVAKFIGEINVFDAIVKSVSHEKITVFLENSVFYDIETDLDLSPGEKIKVLFRPEDLRIETIKDTKEGEEVLFGKIEYATYKGATLDSAVILDNGKKIKASEFFDEDDDDFDYKIGERVSVSWIKGWEVVLKDEG